MSRYYIILALLLCPIFLLELNCSLTSDSENNLPKEEPGLKLETKDKNEDGKPDNWLYRENNGVPVKWIRDSNYDGRPDKWSFFKGGRAFVEEEDTDHDGKVDLIQIILRDSQGNNERYLTLVLKDKRNNTFEAREDTGWISEEDMKPMK